MRAVSTHWIGWVAALVVLGAALRIAAAVQTFPVSIQGDEVYYVGTAQNIARGEGHRFEGFGRAHWPPGHAYLLSRFIDADTIAGDPRVALEHALRLQRAYKWIEGHPGFGDPEGLLFDRIEDPGELHNLRESQPARGAELAALAEAWEGALEPTAPVHQQTRRPLVEPGADATLRFELDAAEKQQLNALGYLEEIAD